MILVQNMSEIDGLFRIWEATIHHRIYAVMQHKVLFFELLPLVAKRHHDKNLSIVEGDSFRSKNRTRQQKKNPRKSKEHDVHGFAVGCDHLATE